MSKRTAATPKKGENGEKAVGGKETSTMSEGASKWGCKVMNRVETLKDDVVKMKREERRREERQARAEEGWWIG